jgi:sugar phosphate isomerase/epimerase
MEKLVSNLVLGSAPDSWGVWFARDERQLPFTRFLDELASAGYTWLELGPYGYLPSDPATLGEHLRARRLRVSGGTATGALHRANAWDLVRNQSRDVARLTAAVGAHHLVFLPTMYRDAAGAYSDEPRLTADAWRSLMVRANELGKILSHEYDVRLCVHPHADSHIETQADIERFLNGTDSRYANLCLDTGHVAYGGGDAIDLIKRYAERIAYVHIKSIDPSVLTQVRAENLSFGQAVQRGVCVDVSTGVPDAASVIAALAQLPAQLYVIAEHDLYPCSPDVPLPIAIRTRAYLTSCLVRTGDRSNTIGGAHHDSRS